MKQRRLALVSLTVFTTLAGCSEPLPVLSSSGGTGSTTGSTTGAGGASATTGAGGASATTGTGPVLTGAGGSTSVAASSSSGAGGSAPVGPFDCLGCICDGFTHYCRTFQGGGAPPPGPASDAPCGAPAPGSSNGCFPLPAECLATPTCACLDKQMVNGWPCQQEGAGLFIHVVAP